MELSTFIFSLLLFISFIFYFICVTAVVAIAIKNIVALLFDLFLEKDDEKEVDLEEILD